MNTKIVVPKYVLKPLIIVLLLLTGFLAHVTGLIDAQRMLRIARAYAHHQSLVLIMALILLQVLLYTFAFPGSTVLWIVAPLYPPLMASLVLTVGGTLGALCAYVLSRNLGDRWIERTRHTRTFGLLRRHNHLLTVFALRVFPGFPHSVINYSSGILGTWLPHFILATAAAMGIKFYLYATVIHSATKAESVGELLVFPVYGPLIGLSVLALAGVLIKHRLAARRGETQ